MPANYAHDFTVAIALTFVCYGTYTYVFTRRRVAFQRAVNHLEAQSDGRLVDSLLNYDTVKCFAAEDAEVRRLNSVLDQWIDARVANQRALTALHVGQSGIIAAGIAAIMLLATQHVVAGHMSVGDLILVNAYIIQICMPLNALGFVFRETNDAIVNVERMFAILTTPGRFGEDIDIPAARPLVVEKGEVAFEQVNFGYDTARELLHNVEFRAYPGKTLAVVGGSGSGKSTLVKLLFRLYCPDRGLIRIDGQDISRVTRRSLREAIGIVPQDTVLFNDTIAYNIAYGRPAATRADVVRAARAAQLDQFIERLPDHYDTRVGERGVRLSGGERQRNAIARAILKGPRIIVFDEATSALDTRSERAIQNELTRLARGRTSIVIAHRLSTVVDADWILVMEHGRVVEQGTHRAMLEQDGVYAKMWSLQWQQGELEHAQRKLSAQSVSLAALLGGVIDGLKNEVIARRVTLRLVQEDDDLLINGNLSILQPLIAERCQNEIIQAKAGERIELHGERHNNHAWISVLSMGDRPAELSQLSAQRLEVALSEVGGSFTLMPLHGHLAYVAVLPLAPVTTGRSGDVLQGRQPPLKDVRVMAVDDREETRDALEAVLDASGARVLLASPGTEALSLLAGMPVTQWPDVLLCDIVLDDEDGYDVLRRVRKLEEEGGALAHDRVPCIALTGYMGASHRQRAYDAGFAAHLEKPLAPDRLIAEIQRVVSAKRRRHDNRR